MARTRTIRRIRKKKNPLLALFPESFQAFIARRLVDIIALAVMACGAAILLALITYNNADPSWNSSGSGAIANFIGLPGAWVSDLLLQTLGAGGFVPGLIMVLWGVRIFRRETLSPFWARLIAVLAGSVFTSMAFALTPSGGWIVHPYLGSTTGTLLLDHLGSWTQALLPGNYHASFAAASGVFALGCFLYAAALTRDELTAFAASCLNAVISAAAFAGNAARAFYEWVLHYNDPDFHADFSFLKAAPRAKIRKTPKLKAEPELELDEDEEDDYEAPATAAPLRAKRLLPGAAKGPSIPVVAPKKAAAPPKKAENQQRFHLSDDEWELPALSLLQEAPAEARDTMPNEDALRRNAELLQNVLADFSIEGEITSIHPGPVVTLYEFEPAAGTKTSKVVGLSDDIARSMSAVSVRCAVVPGRNVIGIELPNKTRQTVYMRELLESEVFAKTKAKLPLILGKDIGGQPIMADLAKMPHLLVAGTTGSGKSVAVNTMIMSLVYRLSPAQCRMIMIDPKMLELSVYDDIPHLLSPVVTEPGKAVVALKWTVQEMEERYRAMSRLGVRNIEGYNVRLREAQKKGETIMRKVQTGFDHETGKPTFEEQPLDLTELPYIVVVVDEFADLMLVAGKDVENAIQRLAQMARAAGIHIIMATQRPSVDVVTGVIKANFPTRISFQVTSKIDSRTILGESGAEQLLGMGDMLYMAPGGRVTRVHGPFVSDKEVESVVDVLKAQSEPAYIEDVTEGGSFDGSEVMNAMFGDGEGNSVDELYDRAVAIVASEGKASTSFIQRHLQIGYNRAARIIEEMERQGVVTKANAVGKRDVLVGSYGDA
jgi:S-DNA-T family DNA segregation ATPase FtsK/SpoIIIE